MAIVSTSLIAAAIASYAAVDQSRRAPCSRLGPRFAGAMAMVFSPRQSSQGGAPAFAADGVVNGASFRPGLASSTWISIFGTNLATSTRAWQQSDFIGDHLPTEMDGVSVRINGKAGYILYVSPTQINLLVPDDDVEGFVQIQISAPQGTSQPVTVTRQRIAPALFMFDADGYKYAAAVHTDGTYVGRPGLYPDLPSRPAKPGDTVLLFGNGFGPTDPPHPASDLVQTPAPLSSPAAARVGDTPARIDYAGLVMAGLYQLNVVVPDVPDGDQAVEVEVAGLRTQDNTSITVRRTPVVPNRPIVVDHTTTDLTQIPDTWIGRVRQNLKMYFGHTSHGGQITSGLRRLEAQYGSKYKVAIDLSLPNESGALSILEAGTYDWQPDFYPTVPRILSANSSINVVMYMWCGQPAGAAWQSLFNDYIADMQALEQRYPNVTFVYATGNAQEQDCGGCVRQRFNQQLRQFVRDNNKVLFDFGDLDAWYNGELHTYPAPNWCAVHGCPGGTSIPSEHPQWGGGDYNNPCGHATYASCDNKGKAMWWLLARIAGWDDGASRSPERSRAANRGMRLSRYPQSCGPLSPALFRFAADAFLGWSAEFGPRLKPTPERPRR